MSTPKSGLTLKPHQVIGIEWLRGKSTALLADSPRAGKTAQLLLASEGRTLAVIPAHLKGTWEREHALWRPDLDLTLVSYSSVSMRAANEQGHLRIATRIAKPEYRNFDTVLCDEAHMLKNLKAKWVGAVASLRPPRLYLATGTPIPNWASELLSLLRLLFPGDKRFTNRTRWTEAWFQTWQPPWGGVEVGDLRKDKTWPEFWFENGLDGPNGRMLQREVDLGVPFTQETIEISMTTAQKKVYDQLAKDYIAWSESGEEVSAWSDGGLHTKLAQVSTGLEILLKEDKGSGKFDVLNQLLDDSFRSPTLVFTHFRATAQLAHDLAHAKGLRVGLIRGGVAYDERDRIEKDFNAGKLDVVVGTLDTLATGLNLAAARTEIFVEHSWAPYKNDQALKRAMEFGGSSVHIIHLWTKGTCDIGMRKTVQEKTDHQIKGLTAREFRSVIYG